MTMIDPVTTATDTPSQFELSEADKLRLDLQTTQTLVDSLRSTLNRERAKLSEFYEALTSGNTDDVTEEDSLTYGELSELMERIFGNPLTFVKEFSVSIQYTVCVEATVKAANREAAREIAGGIELDLDNAISIYDEDVAEVTESYVDETDIQTVREA